MKILMLSSSFPRYEGDYFGPFVLEYCRELVRQGHRVTVVAPAATNTPLNRLSEENLNIERFNYWWPRSAQRLVYPPGIIPQLKKRIWRYLQIPFMLFFYFRKVGHLMKQQSFDVIHSQWVIPSGYIGNHFAKKYGTPHFITSQGAEFFLGPSHFFSKFTRSVLRQCDVLFPVSYQMGERAKQYGMDPDKILVVPNSVNTEIFKPDINSTFRKNYQIEKDEIIILTIRRLVFEKRVEDVIEAFAKPKSSKKLKLVIGGDGPDRYKLESLCYQLGIKDRVIFLGFVNNNELPAIYAASDIYILSSQQEGLSLSLLESMSSGLITISTQSTGGNEVIHHGQNGFLFEVGNTPELTNILQSVLEMEAPKALGIKTNARKTIKEKFSVKHMVDEWVKVYKKLI